MNKSKIEWCDMTWNPVSGCLNQCPYCYARKIANRFGSHVPSGNIEVLELPCVTFPDAKHGYKELPMPYPYDFTPTFHKYRLDVPQKIKKPQNIFVCSMADLFGDWVPNEWIKQVFNVCRENYQHNYLFLTKNPKRYEEVLDRYFPPNFWFGWSQTKPMGGELCFSTHHSIQTFISLEPLQEEFKCFNIKGMEWAIIGAETGNRKDKITPEKVWIDEIVNACEKHRVPVFMKDSLVPIMGEENMLRELPEGLKHGLN